MFDRVIHLRKRAHSLRIGLLSRLGEYASDFPSGTPKETIELLKQILSAAETQIESEKDIRFLEQACRCIQALGYLLAFFDNAHTAQTPRGVTEIVWQLMEKLQPDSKLMVWPQEEFNYSIRNILPRLKALTQHFLSSIAFDEIFGEFPGPLNLVSFPRIERDNVLLHAILGHEIGHPIADKFLASEKGTTKYNEELHRAVQQLTGANGQEGAETEGALDSLAQDITLLLQFRTRGLQELISDCVGALLFGFSAIFASYDVLTLNVLDAPPVPDESQMYPPRRFRLRLQYRILNQIGHVDAIKSLAGVDHNLAQSAVAMLDHLEDVIGKDGDRVNLKADRRIEIAYNWIEEILDEAISFAIKEVGELSFKVDRVKLEVPELVQRIDLGLPPNETGVFPDAMPVDWRSAILAAWLYRIHGKKLTERDGHALLSPAELTSLNRLTMKAIEYTKLQKQYAAH